MPPKVGVKRGPYRKKGPLRALVIKRSKKGYKAQTSWQAKAMPLFHLKAPMPNSYRCIMTYADSYSLSTLISSKNFAAAHWFRLQSIYDPDFTSGGHSPYGYSMMAGIYSKYKVVGTKVIITFNDPSADGVLVGVKMTTVNDPSDLTGTFSVLAEQPQTWINAINNTGSQVITFSKYFPSYMALGVTKLQWNANIGEYTSLFGSNPAQSGHIRIAIASQPGAGILTCNVNFRLEYHVILYDRKVQAQS